MSTNESSESALDRQPTTQEEGILNEVKLMLEGDDTPMADKKRIKFKDDVTRETILGAICGEWDTPADRDTADEFMNFYKDKFTPKERYRHKTDDVLQLFFAWFKSGHGPLSQLAIFQEEK